MLASRLFTIAKELYDPPRGVEFLFRFCSPLKSPTSAIYSMEDYHRQDMAASCIFLATKTEECGRRLRDVARACQAKITGKDVSLIHSESPEVDQLQNVILLTEEVLLGALLHDCTHRTLLCILFLPCIVAYTCYVLAQRARPWMPASLPSASLPTPPSHKPASPDASRFAVECYGFTEDDIAKVSAYRLAKYHSAQDMQNAPRIPPPTGSLRPTLYEPFSQHPNRAPISSYGGNTPSKTALHVAEQPERAIPESAKK
ncbi:uncharacterized protein HD556DRAFT_1434502 [Suillus plorans]|uniref:Uncharacterized protein n=1 Tax=Suillus plorans TaxID=116603 RepID=A0A9P7DC12_9AGAM|nr:uncharacterized protein HD556DRAFT_1434502 [Suillus plorans]KAG1787224.1 hypothetical protein HD556DRAFT_1434502 [Suillus plorans]